AGTAVGVTASSTDVNGPAVTYSLTGDTSGGGFTINAATGVVTIADPSKIVYNAADPTFAITVDASDGTLHSQQTFTIDVVLDLPPTITSGHT
ncbi:cadherin repeat domain-containing protein, partial [Escherichia coli]|nr:cadherin repeat domain-containing protein [Escherichia coli]